MNQKDDILGLGHFLEYRHWVEALKLLKYQLERKKTNRHFNKLEMSYYEKLKTSFGKLENEQYFNTRIANNLFYGVGKEFAVFPYTIPKSNLGLRRYKFMTCPMRVLYYTVGLYLLEISQEYLQGYKSHKHIRAGYGGNLGFNDKRKLILKPNRVYYKIHYENFCRGIRKEREGDTERKVVIRLDIQNYFDELNIPKLLNLLGERVKPTIKRRMCYDERTQTQLIYFFDFIARGASGIPQSDNNIISDFIGHLFLVFGDLFLDEEIRQHNDSVKCHSIIRYADDLYISITFKEQDKALRTGLLNSLAPRIADCLHKKLGLRLNPKTRFFDLRNQDDTDALERNLKQVSEGNEIEHDEGNAPPEEKIRNIFDELTKLRRFPIAPYFPDHCELDSDGESFNEQNFKDILKGVYDDNVQQMLNKPIIKYRLKKLFLGFDFELVNTYPMPIIILMVACDDVQKAFEKYLLSKTHLTSRDISLTLNYLCQTEFSHSNLLNLLEQDPQMKKIMKIFERGCLPSESPGYYALTEEQTLKIAQPPQPHIIEQIRLRGLSEQKGEYSVALNHLLNEIHAICHLLDGEAPTLNKYTAQKVGRFLTSKSVPHETHQQIQNLFDRRNISPVSHADPIASAVAKDEYEKYRFHVGKCLQHLL